MKKKILTAIRHLTKFANRLWYPPLVGLLDALDTFVVVVPTDGITISSSMLTPRRWFYIGTCVAIGSTIGAAILAAIVEWHGLPWVEEHYPGINQSAMWIWSVGFFESHGLWLVFLVAVSPLFQQPAIVLAALAGAPLPQMVLALFAGRYIKFLIMAYIGSHAPRLIGKMWGIQGDLKDVGIEV